MQVKITRNTMAQGQVARAGDVIDLPEKEAKFLISLKKAEEYAQTVSEDVDVDGEEPKPKKKGKVK